MRNVILARHAKEIEQLSGEYDQLRSEYAERAKSLHDRIERLWQAISKDLAQEVPDIADYPMPEAQRAEEVGEGLFNSERDYLDQLSAYKEFRGRR